MLSQSNTEYKWLKNVKNILTSVGRPDIWPNQDQLTSIGISNVIKQTLIDQYKQSWSAQQDSHKSRNCFSFKDTHCFESYFKILDFNKAIDLFRFRTANFKLPVEKLRYESVPYDNRICNLCSQNQVGSESHYLLSCDYFTHERDRFFRGINASDRNNPSLQYFLRSDNPRLLK